MCHRKMTIITQNNLYRFAFTATKNTSSKHKKGEKERACYLNYLTKNSVILNPVISEISIYRDMLINNSKDWCR